jgi:hypothetical protein
LAALAVVILLVVTRDPTEPLVVAAVVVAASIAAACAVALVGVAIEERDAALARRRRPQRAPAIRRGVEIGALLAALGFLRAVDGLSLITGGFVVAGFALAELVLSARPAPRSG